MTFQNGGQRKAEFRMAVYGQLLNRNVSEKKIDKILLIRLPYQ